jgi:hypothetical protein
MQKSLSDASIRAQESAGEWMTWASDQANAMQKSLSDASTRAQDSANEWMTWASDQAATGRDAAGKLAGEAWEGAKQVGSAGLSAAATARDAAITSAQDVRAQSLALSLVPQVLMKGSEMRKSLKGSKKTKQD